MQHGKMVNMSLGKMSEINKTVRDRNLAALFENKIVYLFGAGEWAERFLIYMGEDMRKHISGILVSDTDKNPLNLCGITVQSIDTLVMAEGMLIIVAVFDNKQILSDLKQRGFDNCLPIQEVMPTSAFDDYRLRRNHEIGRYIQYFKDERPLFKYIEIETINRCNGDCSFCPVNRHEKQRQYHKMTEEIFAAIIDELNDLNYEGSVALFSNNEPFLDERIFDFAMLAREKLPKAYIYLFSNGKLLDTDKFARIEPYIDKMQIDNYESRDIPENIQGIICYCKARGLSEKLELFSVDKNTVRFTRAGQAPNAKVHYTEESLCALPFTEIVVRPDGKVSLCCCDALGRITLGDFTKQTLQEIWFGESFKKVREALELGRYDIPLCRYCNTLDFREIFENRVFGVDQAVDVESCIIPNGLLNNESIYIWGCESDAIVLYRELLHKGFSIKAFLESDPYKVGKKIIDGRMCYFAETVLQNEDVSSMGVYITVKHRSGAIFHLLREYGVEDIRLYFHKDPF